MDAKALAERLRAIYVAEGANYVQAAADLIEQQAAEIELAREKIRMLTDHAVRCDTEAFRGNVAALSTLGLGARHVQAGHAAAVW